MKYLLFVLAVIFILFSQLVHAQDVAPTESETLKTDRSLSEQNALEIEALKAALDTPKSPDNLETQKKLQQSAEENARLEGEIVQLKKELNKTNESIDNLVAIQTNAEMDKEKLQIYGFFDTTFYKAWYEHNNSVLITQNPPYSTFMMNNINLYLKSNMTNRLTVLLEARLSFAPLGYETNLPIDAYVAEKREDDLIDSTNYERVDTTIPGGIAATTVRYGSMAVERMYVDWTPRDWLKLRVGKYLTPYGIWNEEHASTVLIGVYYPNLMNWDLLPSSQLGIMGFGTFFPSERIQLDYALTVSNGRGPIDTIMDLDENKGIGARARLSFNLKDLEIIAGGYGYYGKYTDLERRAEAYLNDDYSQQHRNKSPIGGTLSFTNKYKEWIGTTDIAIRYRGLKLFGEYVYRRVEYLTHPQPISEYEFVQNGYYAEPPRRQASHLSKSAYGVLAWTLPLKKLRTISITPYGGIDWVVPDDSYDWFMQSTVRTGINVKPSPFVVLKTEGIVDIVDDTLGGRIYSLSGQIAVSF